MLWQALSLRTTPSCFYPIVFWIRLLPLMIGLCNSAAIYAQPSAEPLDADTMASSAPHVIDIARVSASQVLDQQVQYLEDPNGEFSIDQLNRGRWLDNSKDSLSFGYTRSVYWFRMSLVNSDSQPQKRMLSIGYPVLDDIRVYRNGQPETFLQLGDKIPFSQRPVPHRYFLLPVELQPGEQQQWLFRVDTSSSMQFPLILWQERALFIHEMGQLFGMGIYYGIMLIMVLYNLFVFLSVRESNYLYYVLYVASMTAFIGSLHGVNFQYLWPNAVHWNDQSIVVFLAGVVIFGGLFTIKFLALKDDIAWLGNIFRAAIIAAFAIIFLSNFAAYHLMIRALIVAAVVGICCAIYGGILRWSQGYSSARFYTIAWSSMLLGGVVLALNKFDFLPRNFFTEYAVQVGSALEVILLSFALADRLNQEKRERFEAQLAAFEHEKVARVAQEEALNQERNARVAQEKALEHERQAREAQDKALDIQRKANETLEARVKERTGELEQLNRKLEYLSTTDPLTALRNRRFFEDIIEREMARAIREKESLCVVMLDIDHFKRINDDHGHQAGDEVLRTVASTVKQRVHRNTDLIARYGGEEFILILPNTGIGGAQHVAECLRRSVAQLSFERLHPGLAVTISVGIHGGVPEADTLADQWVKLADDALYRAKDRGRNCVCIYATESTNG